ncbi:hypothetical protein ABGB14_39555 [Nonomuraea sp. B10E15]|uniref:hypothetical protein n=1 Tax=Nonomuraea sp. B10E15 TaxID=3153560 RepID=UPI00325EBA42
MLKLFDDDPISRPLTYPGRIPETSGVLLDDAYAPLKPAGSSPGEWRAAGEPLSALLAHRGCRPLSARHRVVAVGSNAAPSQVRRKFLDRGVCGVVPMTLADVPGVAPGVSAHVSRAGYVPAAPIEAPGETSRLFVLWLDERQLAALDLTEPNYTRTTLAHPLTLEPGLHFPPAFVYAGKHGCLMDAGRRPRRLTSQRALIRSLLEETPGLSHLCGDTPDDFVATVRDDTVRAAASRLLQARPRPEVAAG